MTSLEEIKHQMEILDVEKENMSDCEYLEKVNKLSSIFQILKLVSDDSASSSDGTISDDDSDVSSVWDDEAFDNYGLGVHANPMYVSDDDDVDDSSVSSGSESSGEFD